MFGEFDGRAQVCYSMHRFICWLAVIAVPIAKRLGLGAVLGYLLAGVHHRASVLEVIDDAEDILHFAEFGGIAAIFSGFRA